MTNASQAIVFLLLDSTPCAPERGRRIGQVAVVAAQVLERIREL